MASLIRWQPVRDLDGFVEELERWLGLAARTSSAKSPRFAPVCEVAKREGETVLRFDVPGVNPEQDLEGGMLTITGEHHRDSVATNETARYRESSYRRFERCLALPDGVDPATIHAHYENGVLEVVVPTPGAPEPVHMPVTRLPASVVAAPDAA